MKSQLTPISKYNDIHDINSKLSIDLRVLDASQYCIYSTISYVSDESYCANTYLGKINGTLEFFNTNSLYPTIIIITLYPELFSSYTRTKRRNIYVYSIVHLLERFSDLEKIVTSAMPVLFIFHGLRWAHIVSIFKINGIFLYGIKNTLRHVISPSQVLLIEFLYKIYGSFSKIQSSMISDPEFFKYWITSKTIKVTEFKRNTIDEGNVLISKYLDLYSKYVAYTESLYGIQKLSAHLTYLKRDIESGRIETDAASRSRSIRESIKDMEQRLSKARLKRSEKHINKYLRYLAAKQQDLRELSGLNKKEKLFKELELLKKESVLANNNLVKVTESYTKYKQEFLDYLDIYKSKESEYLNSLMPVIGEMQTNLVKRGRNTKLNVPFHQIRKYSTSVKPLDYSIENSVYSKIYQYTIESNMPENSNSPVRLENIQLKLEQFLNNQARMILDVNIQKEMSINPNILISEIRNYFLSCKSDLLKLIKNLRQEHNNSLYLKDLEMNSDTWSKLNPRDQSRKALYEMLLVITNDEEIVLILLGRLLRIISNKDFINEHSKSSIIYIDVGRALYFLYRNLLYQKYTSTQNYSNYKSFISHSPWSTELQIFNDDIILHTIGAWLIDKLVECNLIIEELQTEVLEIKSKQKVHVLRPSKEIIDIFNKYSIKSEYIGVSSKLPMLVPPREYTRDFKDGAGGYLLNGVNYNLPLIIENFELKNQSTINSVNSVYNMVNYSAKVSFKINKEVLDFILNNNHKYHFLLDSTIKTKFKKRLSIKEKEEIAKYNSEVLMQGHIMRTAIVYRDVLRFYFPTRIDNRGRLYASTDYLSYQGSELAKALLLFSENAKIYKSDFKAIEYFKSYGANLYGNGLSKMSLFDKIKWINENENDIINYTNGILLNKAENKLLFLAFSIEYCKYLNSLNNNLPYWYSDFPIQVDATCNGYQHLALLLGDNSLAKHLNLKTQNFEDKPEDFYSFIGLTLQDYFKERLSDIENPELKENYERLYKLNIHRSLIKKPIMTKPYNVTIESMSAYLLEEFRLDPDSEKRYFLKKEEGRGNIWFIHKKDSTIKLTENDIRLLTNAINYILYIKFPRLLLITEYFKNVARYCNALKISIPWILPSGIEIDQEYLKPQIYRVKPFIYKKSTYNLVLPDTKSINNIKQIRALMPNLIHSLDAASLALVVDLISKKTNQFYSVHDCFASTANNIDDLIKDIRLVYYSIYSKEKYLWNFDNYLKMHISKLANWDISNAVTIRNKEFKYPDISKVLEKNDFDYKELLQSKPVT